MRRRKDKGWLLVIDVLCMKAQKICASFRPSRMNACYSIMTYRFPAELQDAARDWRRIFLEDAERKAAFWTKNELWRQLMMMRETWRDKKKMKKNDLSFLFYFCSCMHHEARVGAKIDERPHTYQDPSNDDKTSQPTIDVSRRTTSCSRG